MRKYRVFFNSSPILGTANSGIKSTNFIRRALRFNLPEGIEINEPTILFSRIEDDVIEKQIAKLGKQTASNDSIKLEKAKAANNADNGLITIEDFAKIKLKVGKVIEAENVPKSKKLIKMKVKIGEEQRQILAGVAEHYKPEDLIGKSIIVAANLQPAKLMGLESQGMMLCASDNEQVIFLTPEREIADGVGVR